MNYKPVIIVPGGESFDFGGMAVNWKIDGAVTGKRFEEINKKYSLEMDFDSVPGLCQRFGVTFPEL
jgi:hypothetical protein